MNIFDKKRVLVVGIARSGQAAAILLLDKGFEVYLYDDDEGRAISFAAREDFPAHRTEVVRKEEARAALDLCDCLVVSPGVPLDHPLVKKARNRGKDVIGEIELAYQFCSSRIVAVTGTNGKSTVTDLLGKIMKEAGRSVAVAGNIGHPFSATVSGAKQAETVVLELSSFQLDTVDRFRADVAVLLNVAPDHLDRYHGSLGEYTRSKEKILNRADQSSIFVYNRCDPVCRRLADGFPGRAVPFSSRELLAEGVYYRGGKLVCSWQKREEEIIERKDFTPLGIHNMENALAAVAAAVALGVDSAAIADALRRYRPLPHRMEMVRVVGGVAYINDSKATNADATMRSLGSLDGKVVLIMGGRDKEGDFTSLRPLMEKVRGLVLLGEAAAKLADVLGDACSVHTVSSMAEAVAMASTLARPGDTVLLAPGCASFDMFRDYKERGEIFRQCVKEL